MKHLYLVDGSGFVFRAYHAIRASLTTSKGLQTNAVLGFTNMLLKLRREKHPELLAVVFDAKGKSFRHEMYEDYKANRKEMPDDLKPQWEYVYKVAEVLGIPTLRVPDVEADDVIATLTKQARDAKMRVTIVSSDKDLMQLVTAHVQLYDTMKDLTYDRDQVKKKFGVGPELLGDLLALVGDSSDNVPGVPGVGPKTALALLEQFGNLQKVLGGAEQIKRPKLRAAIGEHAEAARLSRRLVALREDVGLDVAPGDLKPKAPSAAAPSLFRELEFTRALKELEAEEGAPYSRSPPLAAIGGSSAVSRDEYRTIVNESELDEVIAAIRKAGHFAVDTETTSLDPMRADLVGVSLAWAEGQACYVPVGHRGLAVPKQLALELVLDKLRPLLEDSKVPTYGQNHKYDTVVLRRVGIDLRGIAGDPMIASYLLDPSRASHSLDSLAAEYLGHDMITFKDVAGSGKKQINFEEVEVPQATEYAAEDADVTLRLAKLLLPRIESEHLGSLLHDIEIPLARVLAVMEMHGVKVDVDHLRQLGSESGKRMHALEQEIHGLAGYEVNVNSPIQLRELLFEKLGLPIIRKTKTGPSTDADVLEQLSSMNPIPAKILEFRGIAKLKSTYIDSLPSQVNPTTGRLHPHYNQAVAATGRLSASDPNVQNIPIRTELGREIRRAFIAEPGNVLISCDYSQIELRVLAHLSEDPILVDGFHKNQDVHARTASEVFGVDIEAVSPDMRRIAKSVVYGLSYGQTDFGLSRSLGISKSEAKKYIEDFFGRYEVLGKYLDSLVEKVRGGEPAKTLLGRRRFIPDIKAKNFAARGYAERIARNTPIQGTAADIFKLAMIRVQEELEATNSKTRMLLTVHDELVFEAPKKEAEKIGKRIRKIMESVIELEVPLRVDVGSGPTWNDAH